MAAATRRHKYEGAMLRAGEHLLAARASTVRCPRHRDDGGQANRLGVHYHRFAARAARAIVDRHIRRWRTTQTGVGGAHRDADSARCCGGGRADAAELTIRVAATSCASSVAARRPGRVRTGEVPIRSLYRRWPSSGAVAQTQH